MGANSTQAIALASFLLGFTLLSAGFASGAILYFVAAVVFLVASIVIFLKIKPLEHAEN
ncbi:MAG TPA: hypothetical protein VNY24_01265 [Candidatus Acidoferrales bacterium]|nr:hypothetical protein [Candidatus Acidoferrales bacterium]